MKILVAGGCGFIGASCVRQAQSAGHSVLVIDDLSSGYRDNLPDSVTFCEGDVSVASSLDVARDWQPDAVIHLAALFANQNSIDRPIRDLQVSGVGTLNLIQLALELRDCRLVFASSSCVYGDQGGALAEQAAPGPADTPYAATKWLAEEYVRMMSHLRNLDFTIIRPFNVYGPGDRPGPYRSVIPNFFDRAFRGQPLRVTGTGEETRDFTFVEDVASVIVASATQSALSRKTLNAGTGREVSIWDLATKIGGLVDTCPGVELVPRRAWDTVERRKADTTELENSGFHPSRFTQLDEGLKMVHAWFTAWQAG